MAVFSTIGSVINANSQRKAADKVVDVSQANNRENNALARENRDLFFQRSDPFVSGGTAAFNMQNALLGISGGPQQAGMQMANEFGGDAGTNPRAYAAGAQPNALMGNPQQNAFDIFKNSTGYQSRLNAANDAFNSEAASGQWLQSGAAILERDRRNQEFASNEFANYFNMLGNQSAAGLGALGAQAGVGTNYTGQVTANNNSNAANIGNAALARGANNPFGNALMGIGQAGQQVAGAFLGGGFG